MHMDQNQRNNTTQQSKVSKLTLGRGQDKATGDFELILNWYKISGRTLAGEEIVSGLHIRKLLKVLGNPIWNHIYHCWEVELKHMPDIQPYIEHKFDPAKFVYFIEAYNISET